MLKEEKTNRYALSVNAPIIHFDLGNIGFKMDWANKVMVDEDKEEVLILIKHDTTHNNLENIEIGQIVNLSIDYLSKNRDDGKIFKTNKEYKHMHLINKYHTDICFISDMVKIFSNTTSPKNLDRLIRREENQQDRNTIYKLKPSNNTYNVSCDMKIDADKFAKDMIEMIQKQIKSI